MKEVRFVGRALDELREFPPEAKHDSGVELPMPSVGRGVREIRVSTGQGIYRTLYTTVLGDCVYVLHCFTKKSAKTPQSAITLGKQRLQAARSDAEKERSNKP
ncbi:type II toxin-antitoxin system RelE/ParE family toxin [Mycolicibacter kumamotonensis]|uniref:type II toxin-antitoxin system RelE/ParE family toxin n=1 Tax=Mycolicibacter kumamotonensis TaxID=354243 RepID=UPI0009FF6561|nr:type II toxin-antitoxin system RelE/ParE family toxin [Mycolicibacter kumamotonensis]